MQWADRIGRRIKLRDLHVLQAVVQAGSMTKAAGELAISVPVVSKAIAELEHTVGVPLLDRSPQGVEPTAYGRALLRRGLAAFDELRQGIKDIEFLADPTAGEVRIASTAPLAASFVSGVIDRLSRRYPRIVFHPTVADTEILRRELGERNVDLVIGRRFGAFADEQLDFDTLYDNPYVVMAGANNPWVRQAKGRACRVDGRAVGTAATGQSVGSFFAEVFRAQGLDFPQPPWSPLPTRCASICWNQSLSHNPPRILAAISRSESTHQEAARRTAAAPHADRDHHLEEPDAQSGGAALHRRARDIAKPLAKGKAVMPSRLLA